MAKGNVSIIAGAVLIALGALVFQSEGFVSGDGQEFMGTLVGLPPCRCNVQLHTDAEYCFKNGTMCPDTEDQEECENETYIEECAVQIADATTSGTGHYLLTDIACSDDIDYGYRMIADCVFSEFHTPHCAPGNIPTWEECSGSKWVEIDCE